MPGGTLLVSRAVNWFPHFKTRFEVLGFRDVHVTGKEKDALNAVINDVKPKNVLISSNFYDGATPFMVGELIKAFPKVRFSVLSSGYFPDRRAVRFIFNGAKAYVNLADGIEEFHLGLKNIREGNDYVAPDVKKIIDNLPAFPETKSKADKRQLEILVLLCNGKKPAAIADSFHISKRTVDWHIGELCKVFHANSRNELIGIAFYLGVVTKDDLRFFGRGKEKPILPPWAAAQLTMKN
jgi:DNA-binding NarL/FixJ family response regulator